MRMWKAVDRNVCNRNQQVRSSLCAILVGYCTYMGCCMMLLGSCML